MISVITENTVYIKSVHNNFWICANNLILPKHIYDRRFTKLNLVSEKRLINRLENIGIVLTGASQFIRKLI